MCSKTHAECNRQPKGKCEKPDGHSLSHKCGKCGETFEST